MTRRDKAKPTHTSTISSTISTANRAATSVANASEALNITPSTINPQAHDRQDASSISRNFHSGMRCMPASAPTNGRISPT